MNFLDLNSRHHTNEFIFILMLAFKDEDFYFILFINNFMRETSLVFMH